MSIQSLSFAEIETLALQAHAQHLDTVTVPSERVALRTRYGVEGSPMAKA